MERLRGSAGQRRDPLPRIPRTAVPASTTWLPIPDLLDHRILPPQRAGVARTRPRRRMGDPVLGGILSKRKAVLDATVINEIVQAQQDANAGLCEYRVRRLEGNVIV